MKGYQNTMHVIPLPEGEAFVFHLKVFLTFLTISITFIFEMTVMVEGAEI